MSGREWYDNYLQSDHWLQLREVKFAAADRMCERCGEGAKRRPYGWIGLQVHHLTYDRIGREELDDLIVLCIHCHQVEHGLAADTQHSRIKVRKRLAVGVAEYFFDGFGVV